MYAIVKIGGRQYRVEAGDVIQVDRLPNEADNEVTFDQVLAVADESRLQTGSPYIEGARAVATVLKHGRGPKIRVFKYKPKTGYRRRKGHRQDYTQVRIERIEV